MEEASVTWRILLRVWWRMFWRISAGLMLVCGLLEPLKSEKGLENIQIAIIFLFIICLGLWATRSILNKNIGEYRLILIKNTPKTIEKRDNSPQKE